MRQLNGDLERIETDPPRPGEVSRRRHRAEEDGEMIERGRWGFDEGQVDVVKSMLVCHAPSMREGNR